MILGGGRGVYQHNQVFNLAEEGRNNTYSLICFEYSITVVHFLLIFSLPIFFNFVVDQMPEGPLAAELRRSSLARSASESADVTRRKDTDCVIS